MVKYVASVLLLAMAAMTAGASAPRPSGDQRAKVQNAPMDAAILGLTDFDIQTHVDYILRSQRATGALAMTPAHLAINPYFGNLAALALLTRPGHLKAVERHMDWYLRHLNPDGTIFDFEVRDGREIATGHYDSTDSYAATFLSVVSRWVQAGGDPEWIRRNRSKLDMVGGAILAVTDVDGLTWAKPGYPMKLFMDNCEVYAGWSDWAVLMDSLGDPLAAASARGHARRLKSELERFRQPNGPWSWAIHKLGFQRGSTPERLFYPDAVAQVFPLVFGLTDDPGDYYSFNTAQPAWRGLGVSSFPWLLPAYAAALAGDGQAVKEALTAVSQQHRQRAWPWFIAESAWVIKTWSVLPKSAPDLPRTTDDILVAGQFRKAHRAAGV